MKEALFWTSVLVLMYGTESKEIEDFDDGCVPILLQPYLPKMSLVNTMNFCQEEKGVTEYISSYDIEYNVARFSAAIVKPSKNDLGEKPGWTQGLDGKLPPWRPRKKDYTAFEDFDKGHLFPWAYARNADQGKSTMRLTNAVPQDKVFNQQVWSKAERHLKKKFINVCNAKKNQKSIVVTGAVPAYFGDPMYFKDGKTKDDYHMRIGVSENSKQASYDPLPFKVFALLKPELHEDLKERLTVPTHMWTYFACVNTQNTQINVIRQTSYIGLNYRTGVIKWYKKFEDFENTLKKMYHSTTSIFYREFRAAAAAAGETDIEGPNTSKFCKQGKSLNEKFMKCQEKFVEKEEDEFWDEVNIHEIRHRNEERRLTFLLALYGQGFKSHSEGVILIASKRSDDNMEGIIDSNISPESDGSEDRDESDGGEENHNSNVSMEKRRKKNHNSNVSMEKRRKKNQNSNVSMEKRRKRSANKEVAEEEEPNIKPLGTLSIIDQDPNRDFELSSCEILERNTTGQVQETHTYDFKRNVLIEDRNPGGSVLSAKYVVNGTETAAEEETSNHQEIKIVLSPRYAPTSPTTSTTTTTTTSTTTQTPTTTTASTTTTTPTTTTTLTTTTTSTTTTTQTTTTTPTTTTTLN